MKWLTLHCKIGRLEISKTRKADVYAIIDDKKVFLTLKYDAQGKPYLVKDDKLNRVFVPGINVGDKLN